MKNKRIGTVGVINHESKVYLVDSGFNSTLPWTQITDGLSVNWETEATVVQGKKIVPYGTNNNLPAEIRNILDANNLAPGILEREAGLLRGQGPQLYRKIIENDDVVTKWVKDPEIEAWLKSWDFKRYVDMAVTEYKHLKGFFVRRTAKRGMRIGRRPEWYKLEVLPAIDCRLEWTDSRRLEDVRNIFTGDFETGATKGLQSFSVYDHANPWAKGICMSYHNTYSFARRFYSVPGFYGTLKWIQRSSDIPELLKYLTDNGLSLTHHIHSPAGYWEEKKEYIQRANPTKTDIQVDKLLEELMDETFTSLTRSLSGKTKAGKFIHTVDLYDEGTKEILAWKIESIDHKIKEFIEAQLAISKAADAATTSGIGLHPSLSNIMVDGKLASGSEMLYALKLYLASDTSVPEEVIFEPINQAIADMWPNKDVKIGFYHKIVLREEDVSPKDRVTNNT